MKEIDTTIPDEELEEEFDDEEDEIEYTASDIFYPVRQRQNIDPIDLKKRKLTVKEIRAVYDEWDRYKAWGYKVH